MAKKKMTPRLKSRKEVPSKKPKDVTSAAFGRWRYAHDAKFRNYQLKYHAKRRKHYAALARKGKKRR